MRIYWKQDGEQTRKDALGNPVYKQIERSGILLGTSYSNSSDYNKVTMAVSDGKFVTKHTYECYHKEFE